MLKKTKSESGVKAVEQAKELSQAVLNSSHQIWLAGLGAFARAQAEGMKVFESLVRQGEQLETRTRQVAADTALAARGAATAKAREMQQMAGGTWDKLEQVFEDRVARALSKLGVHTQSDVQKLSERVDALSAAVNRLINQSEHRTGSDAHTPAPARRAKKSGAAKKAAGAKRAAKKTAGKRAKGNSTAARSGGTA